jgi:N,N'-diacetyllegionaminate synthase
MTTHDATTPAGIRIGDRAIGPGQPCFVIAEAGVNHDGDLDVAFRLVEAAAAAGADAVKFQSFSADALATADAPKAAYQQRTTDAAESQRQMLRRLELDAAAHREIQARCRDRGIVFLSSPFDVASADMLAALDVPAFKIPSGEITNPALLAHVAGHRRPVILSTGMATLDEVDAAVTTLRGNGGGEIVLLHCVSNYPADPADCNLRAMATMARKFGLAVGYSDHTPGDEVAIAAVALGACLIEKHLTLDRTRPGPDHAASMEPEDFARMIARLRRAESALGDGDKRPAASETATASVARRSLVAAIDIAAGTTLTDELIASRRPGTGIAPGERHRITGRVAARDIARDTLISFDMLA